MGEIQQARAAFERALVLAKTIEPDFQIRSVPNIEERINSLDQTSAAP
jgi:hypothetical protein